MQFMVRTLIQRSAVLEVPIWAVYAAIPVGAALEAVLHAAGRRRAATPGLGSARAVL